jgi:hypothetical protein
MSARCVSNHFDADCVTVTGSADTSISSVTTEPHLGLEPTTRRRVSPPQCGSRSPTECGPIVRKNNPYMYNVLGEHASPGMAARTSPIPRAESPMFNNSLGRNQSFEVDDERTDLPPLASVGAAAPVLGSYMAACYSSAFPPGQFAKPVAPIVEVQKHEPRTRRGRRGGPADLEVSPPSSPLSPNPTSPTTPMTRVYRNGRPVPVPTFLAK